MELTNLQSIIDSAPLNKADQLLWRDVLPELTPKQQADIAQSFSDGILNPRTFARELHMRVRAIYTHNKKSWHDILLWNRRCLESLSVYGSRLEPVAINGDLNKIK